MKAIKVPGLKRGRDVSFHSNQPPTPFQSGKKSEIALWHFKSAVEEKRRRKKKSSAVLMFGFHN